MKLNSIGASNILSFKWCGSFDEIDCISLNPNTNLCINIGPNGSGKSNFLEIIAKLFSLTFFTPYTINHSHYEQVFNQGNQQNIKGIIGAGNNKIPLRENRYSQRKDQKIKISVILSQTDINNIRIIGENYEQLKTTIEKYSNSKLNPFHNCSLETGTPYTLNLERATDLEPFTLARNSGNNEKALFEYLTQFDLVRQAIQIINREENGSLPTLVTSFIFMNTIRNYNLLTLSYKNENNPFADEQSFKSGISQYSFESRQVGAQAPNQSEFLYVTRAKNKLAEKYWTYLKQGGENFALTQIKSDNLYVKLSEYLKTYLNLSFDFSAGSPGITSFKIELKDLSKNEHLIFQELSSGQKAIFCFIFTLLADNLQDGFIFIDEPELHLHPQMQEVFADLINKAKSMSNTQVIFSTHSPYFLNASNISNVNRFFMTNEGTKVISPSLDEGESDLIQILKFKNSTAALFAQKIVLVEGQGDAYFFRALFEELNKDLTDRYDYEIVEIGGKTNYEKWKLFLNKFEIDFFYIADFDNIKDFGVCADEVNKLIQENIDSLTSPQILKEENKDRENLFELIDYYSENSSHENWEKVVESKNYYVERIAKKKVSVESIKSQSPELYKKICTEIENLYESHIFILKQGHLEDYLGVKKHDIDQIITFSNALDATAINSGSNEFEELKQIFSMIFRRSEN